MKRVLLIIALLFLALAYSVHAEAYSQVDIDKCSSDSDCATYDKCVHGTCRTSETYCGDNFCDPNERCECSDCINDPSCIATKPDFASCNTNKICEVNESCGCQDCRDFHACKPEAKKILDGQACEEGSQCLEGSYCIHGICRQDGKYCGDNYCDLGENTLCPDCDRFSYLKGDGQQCSSDSECGGLHCVHNSCSSSENVCGDGYCDANERCNCPECFNQQHCLVFPYASTEIRSTGRILMVLSLIVSLVIGIAAFALTWKGKHLTGEEKNEYTWKTLFFPGFRGKSLSQKLALLIVNPLFWLAEAAIAIAIVFWSAGFSANTLGADAYAITTMGIIFGLGFPFFILFISWLIDYYEREPLRFVFAMFMWGVLSTVIPLFVNTGFMRSIINLMGGKNAQDGGLALSLFATAVFLAPLIEEAFKGLGLLIISAHHEFDDISDGILYGFAIGIGFAFIENLTYFLKGLVILQATIASGTIFQTPTVVSFGWLLIVLVRIFEASIAHGIFTATTGLFIGLFKQKYRTKKMIYLGFGIGLAVAITLHFMNNLLSMLASVIPAVVILLPFINYSIALILLAVTLIAQHMKAKKEAQSEKAT